MSDEKVVEKAEGPRQFQYSVHLYPKPGSTSKARLHTATISESSPYLAALTVFRNHVPDSDRELWYVFVPEQGPNFSQLAAVTKVVGQYAVGKKAIWPGGIRYVFQYCVEPLTGVPIVTLGEPLDPPSVQELSTAMGESWTSPPNVKHGNSGPPLPPALQAKSQSITGGFRKAMADKHPFLTNPPAAKTDAYVYSCWAWPHDSSHSQNVEAASGRDAAVRYVEKNDLAVPAVVWTNGKTPEVATGERPRTLRWWIVDKVAGVLTAVYEMIAQGGGNADSKIVSCDQPEGVFAAAMRNTIEQMAETAGDVPVASQPIESHLAFVKKFKGAQVLLERQDETGKVVYRTLAVVDNGNGAPIGEPGYDDNDLPFVSYELLNYTHYRVLTSAPKENADEPK